MYSNIFSTFILLTCLSSFSFAKETLILKCIGEQKVAVSDSHLNDFSESSYVKIKEVAEFYFVIGDGFVELEGHRHDNNSEYHGGKFSVNEVEYSAWYRQRKSFHLSRLTGDFSYQSNWWMDDVKSTYYGKFAQTKLKNGNLSRVVKGTCTKTSERKF